MKKYRATRKKESEKCYDSLDDGDVDKGDLMNVVFEIFSKRKKFNYDLGERIRLYIGFVGPVCKFLRCCDCKRMIQNNKLYEKAKERLEAECDIVEVMDQVRRSKNFQRNFLSRRQKILLKFD